MTEAEAKTKWCPFAPTGVFTDQSQRQGCLCIASECMAWRWQQSTEYQETLSDNFAFSNNSELDRRGFCGLARGRG